MRTQNRFQSPAILLAIFLVFLVTSCEVDKEENKPVVVTNEVTAIKSTEALCGGTITSDGGYTITARGVCWSTDPNPTIDDNKTTDGAGAGSFISQMTDLQPNTNYYVRAFATNSNGTGYGMAMAFETIDTASLSTTEPTEISYRTAVCGGTITSDGGQTIAARGVCWSTSPDSVELGNALGFTVDGSGIGSFESLLYDLTPRTTYYIRAYATNSIETFYGDIKSFNTLYTTIGNFTDTRDGSVYKTVKIGDQTWMSENLRYLPNVVGPGANSETTAYYYVYDYDGTNVADAKATANYNNYGVLYNWPAATNNSAGSSNNPSGVKGACPTGWHLPSDAEWAELINLVGNNAGTMLKATSGWISDGNGTDDYGFSALPGGFSFKNGYGSIGSYGHWWSATESRTSHAWSLHLGYDDSNDGRSEAGESFGFSVRCVMGDAPSPSTPTLTTSSVVSITYNTAESGGNISSDGGSIVFARGVCWNTDPNPTIDDNKTSDGTGTGEFTSTLNTLTLGTTYYLRAYATNYVGTAYGEEVSFTTIALEKFSDSRDGNVYKYVTIGDQVWMAENLKYLPSVVGPESESTTTPFYYVYGYEGTNVSEAKANGYYQTYGVLYNWPAAMAGMASSSSNPSGVKGACPTGWHLPSDAEWAELIDYLGGWEVAGGKLKVTGTSHWDSPNTGATNEKGFTALPAGLRYEDGTFNSIGYNGLWWCATKYDTDDAYCRNMVCNGSDAHRYPIGKEYGFSVRCVKD